MFESCSGDAVPMGRHLTEGIVHTGAREDTSTVEGFAGSKERQYKTLVVQVQDLE